MGFHGGQFQLSSSSSILINGNQIRFQVIDLKINDALAMEILS